MSNPFTAAPGERDYDADRDEDDFHDARCDDCGAAADTRCTEDCACDDCQRRQTERDDTEDAHCARGDQP